MTYSETIDGQYVSVTLGLVQMNMFGNDGRTQMEYREVSEGAWETWGYLDGSWTYFGWGADDDMILSFVSNDSNIEWDTPYQVEIEFEGGFLAQDIFSNLGIDFVGWHFGGLWAQYDINNMVSTDAFEGYVEVSEGHWVYKYDGNLVNEYWNPHLVKTDSQMREMVDSLGFYEGWDDIHQKYFVLGTEAVKEVLPEGAGYDAAHDRYYNIDWGGVITPINANPALSSAIADATTNEDVAYSYDASANFSDADVGDILTYSATLADDAALPSWLSINSSTGVLSGTPANGDNGAIDITVTATDTSAAAVSDTYTLTVKNNILNGTSSDDTLTVSTDTTSIQAGAGTDTVVFSGNYADYSFSQSDSFVPLMTHNTTAQVVSLYGVEKLVFDDTSANLVTNVYSEFQVNTVTLSSQYYPDTTALNDGGFVITWTSNNQDGSSDGIYAQRYDGDGLVNGNEFLVNTYTSSQQYNPSTTALNDGGFVITWQSRYQDGDGYGIYAQRYDADGSVNGVEFQVNTYTSSSQDNPSTTALNDGGFVITWESSGQDGSAYGIYAQRYDADGLVNGNEFQVNTYTSDYQRFPSTSALSDGGFVITWTSKNQDGDGWGIYAQRYDGDGLVNGSEFQVNTYTSSSQYKPSTTALNDGGFVITWHSDNQDGSGYGIYAQRYDANGLVNGSEFQVNTYTSNHQTSPSTTALNDGGFVITWTSYNQDDDGGGYGVYAQRYDADGNAGTITLNANPVITASGDIIAEGTAMISGTATHTDADADNDDNIFTAVTDVASTYGTYSVTTAGVWTYTLDSDDATVKALSEGQSTTDTITVTAEDGTTKDVTITINGNDIRTISTSISEALSNLGFTSINGLVSTWNDETNTVSVSFDSAVNESFSLVEHIPTISLDVDDYIGDIIKMGLEEGGISNIQGYSFVYDEDKHYMEIKFDSATGSGVTVSNYNLRAEINPSTKLIEISGSAHSSSVGNVTLSNSDLSSVEQEAFKSLLMMLDAIATVDLTDTNDIGMIALSLLGYTDVTGLSTTWNASTQTATLILDSALYGYTPITYLQLIVTTNSSGSISSYYSAITANGVTGYYDKYDLDDSEVFVIEATVYTLNEIDRITSNHDFTNGVATIVFDDDGNLSDFSLSITHSDVGVVTKTASNLNETYVGYLTAMYDQLNTTTPTPILSSPIYDASTNEDAAYSYDASANFSDADVGDTLTYSATLADDAALPSWLSINSTTGVLSGTPENEDVGAIDVTVTATDTNSASISDTYTLTVNNVNDTPTVSTVITDAPTNEDASYSYDASANFSDADVDDTLTYSATLSDESALPTWLSINTTTGILSGTPANADIGTINVTVTATDSLSSSVSDTYILTVSNVNYDPTGTVTISGDTKTGQTLTAANDLADVDGLGAISYQWAKDSVDISGATNSTLLLSDSHIGSTITVTASYTDDDGTAESVSSIATSAVTDIDKPFFFSAEVIEASAITTNSIGNYVDNPTENIIKLTLNVDMARVSDNSVGSITQGSLDFVIDWSNIEVISYLDGAYQPMYIQEAIPLTATNYAGGSVAIPTTGGLTYDGSASNTQFNIITVSSMETSSAKEPELTLVDNVDTTPADMFTAGVDYASSIDLWTFYLNPIDSIDSLEITFGGLVSINQGADDITQVSYTMAIDTTGVDAMIKIDADNYLDNTTIQYYQNGTDTTVATLVEEGGIKIEQSTDFDAVKLSATDAYDFDINISDAIDVLRHIVDLQEITQGSSAFHAADTDNNGNINISDAIDILRHIVDLEAIDTFDLIDSNGNRVTQLDANASGEPPTWTIVANGDVDMSGSFADDYVIASDLV